jgi:hypothetical protein
MLGAFRDHAFRGHTLSLVMALRDIDTDYAAQGMRLTVRQLYYQCVTRGWIENNEREYQKIIRLLTDEREAGLFDWDAIEDRGPNNRHQYHGVLLTPPPCRSDRPRRAPYGGTVPKRRLIPPL